MVAGGVTARKGGGVEGAAAFGGRATLGELEAARGQYGVGVGSVAIGGIDCGTSLLRFRLVGYSGYLVWAVACGCWSQWRGRLLQADHCNVGRWRHGVAQVLVGSQ